MADNEKVWTPSNVITMTRIALVPAFVAALLCPWPEWMGAAWLDPWKPWVAAAVFVVISCTDWLDGYLARKRNEVTDLGKFMDPLADKILVVAALLVLVELGSLPSWIALIIVAREFIISGVRMVAASKGEVIAASWYGKFKTVFTMVAIVAFVVLESPLVASFSLLAYQMLVWFSWITMVIALGLTVFSMVDYISKARHLIGFKPKGSAASGASRTTTDFGTSRATSDAAASLLGDASLLGTDAETMCTGEFDAATYELAEKVVALARNKGVMVATAESCTGGLISGALTSVPGSSYAVAGGIVSYSNTVKEERLGVQSATLQAYGAVSEQTALEMAQGACQQLGVDLAVSVTGIAGPGGAVEGKPVGTVWIGCCTAGKAAAVLYHFEGDRSSVRLQTVKKALETMVQALA